MADIDINEARRITSEKEAQYGLPAGTLFKVGGIESSFNGNAVSPKGAKGYFQFMPDTAAKYGLTDPSDFNQSADAAGRYLRDNIARYGDIDAALADYNGGPKAVAALRKGKPWRETADYLNKFHGEDRYQASAQLPAQFTTGEADLPTMGASVTEMWQQEQRDEAYSGGPTIAEGVATGWQLDNSVYNWWQTKSLESYDLNFQWTQENSEAALNGIPQRYWDYVLQAKSEKEAMDRRGRTLDSIQKEQELAKMGVAGLAGRLVGGLADLPTLLAFVPYIGGEAALTVTSRVANAIRAGLIGASSNVAYDAAAMSYRPLAEDSDLYISALMGLSLGAAGGAMVNPAGIAARRALAEENKALSSAARRSALEEMQGEFKSRGYDLTKEGEEFFRRSIEATSARNTQVVTTAGKFEFNPEAEYRLRNGVLEEAKAPIPEFNRTMMADAYGAEERVTKYINRNGHTKGFMERVFKFSEDGKIDKVETTNFNKGDLRMLGIETREHVEELVKRAKEGTAYQKLVQFAKKESATDNLEKLSKSSDPSIAVLAKRLKEQFIDDVPVFRVRQKDIDDTFGGRGGRFAGFYSSSRHGVFVPNDATEGTMLHEILHAATVHKIDYGMAHPESTHGKLVGELNSLYELAKAEAQKQGFKYYYLSNLKEFTAGLYTGDTARSFQKFLSGIAVEGSGSLLNKIVDVFRKLFGFNEEETNALLKALDLTDKLVDERLTVNLDRGPKFTKDTINFHSVDGEITPDAIAAHEADIPPIFGWGLGLEHRLGNDKIPQAVRNLAAKLFGTTVGYKDHSVVKANAWDDTIKWAESWAVEMRKGTYPKFEEWFKQTGMKSHEKGKAFDTFGTQVSNYIRGIEGEYAKEVVAAGDHMRKTLAKVVDYINNPLFEQGGYKRGLTEQEIVDIKSGITDIVGTLEKNPNYLPRKHDVNKWQSMVSKYGLEAVEGWWARAYKAGRGEAISDEEASKFGQWYVKVVDQFHSNRIQDRLDDMFRGQDREALKASLMTEGGFDSSMADRIIENMLPTKPRDTGRTGGSLKHRNTIDETYSETWTTASGEKVTVGINDFIISNAFDAVEPYLRRTAASVALAKHLDIYKMGDIDKLINEATGNTFGSGFKPVPEITKMRDDLKFAFDRVLGVPQEEFTWWRKGLSMWRDFNVIRLMGGAVYNQVVEFSQIVGSMGWRTTLQAIPELRALRRDITTGKAPNDILDHLENTIGGVGSEYVARMEFKASDDWSRNLGDSDFHRRLDQIDTGIKRMARGVLDYTGMTPLMIQQKRVHAVALVNHFVNHANGKEVSTFLSPERLAWMGMDQAKAEAVYESIRKYTKPHKGEFGETFKMDFDKWVEENPQTHADFMTAIHRESRRVVQENDLASMVPIMGTTLGKTMFQFMNFSLHGWNKSMLFAMNHRDYSTLSTVLHGSLLASMAYMGRTMMQASGRTGEDRDTFLEKRMSSGQIVANSFGRIAQVSLLPSLYDTFSPYPAFSGLRTTNDLTSLASNPTLGAMNSLVSMKKIVSNSLSDDTQTTQQDVRSWMKLLPLNNVFPMVNLLNGIADDYPTSENQ